MLVSFRRARVRATANPRVPFVSAPNRSCESGMRNSALQPDVSRATATSHTASQLSSWLMSLKWYVSIFTPSGFTANE